MKKIRTKLYQVLANTIINVGSSDVSDSMFVVILDFGMRLDDSAIEKGIWLE
jgi:hypothetical protein